MNLILETKKKLDYQNNKLEDLQKCLEKPISSDANKYLSDEIVKVKRNMKYYSELLKILEVK
ncbi:hypothetical protein [Clostridium sp. VAP51]|uniref:hypothetical protein n=1 Tax=Clostridium sp. VAP51 TaxID=2949978 RepID=UPI002079DBD2|nr:hypothetical protein [Clostridium sp. VAP51]